MNQCNCQIPHETRRIVLTGGPGAGKTPLLELIPLFFCVHVRTLPEAAGIVFGGGFPRNERLEVRQASQRAIFHVQRELEATEPLSRAAVVLCDRGTVDGAAYWPGPGDLWSSVATTHEQELARYHAVIHLRTPLAPEAYPRDNPLRVETHEEAAVIDERIERLWSDHPRLFDVKGRPDFLAKAVEALSILRGELPECCRKNVKPIFGSAA